jgi:glyoxylase-like metal-dependent hydrolase (beta-lactamase superfamily II)
MAEVRTPPVQLKWDVFVTPGIPSMTTDLPPGAKQRLWSPMSSTLISGKRDAVLVDTFITVEQASALADWVAASGKNVTTIYATHGHGDHFFGASTVLERFPYARFVATPDVVKVMSSAGVAAVPCVVLECAFPRSDFRSPRDRRRTQRERH